LELSWLESLIYGLISGFAEFLPVSSLAHQTIYLKLIGASNHPILRFCAHLGSFGAVLMLLFTLLLRLRREQKIAHMGRNRRRQPDETALMEARLLRMALISMFVVFFGYRLVGQLYQRMWLLAILIGINGIMLYLPPYLPGANKGAVSLSALDGMLIGLSAGAGIVPGISTMGWSITTAKLRGTDKRYATEVALMLTLGSLPAWMLIDVIEAFGAASFSGPIFLYGVTVAAASFLSGYLSIKFMRFLAVKAGYSGFAYYCWGTALFALILYLI
jgi:undecaprenyl-diphosphatase